MPAEEFPELSRQVAALERRLERLELASRAPSTSLSEGAFRVLDAAGTERVRLGQLDDGSFGAEIDDVPMVDLLSRLETYYDFKATLTPATATRGSYQPVFEPPVLDAPDWAEGAIVACTAVLVIPTPSSTGWFDATIGINGEVGGESFGWQYNGDTAQCVATVGTKLLDVSTGVEIIVRVSNISTSDDLEMNLTTLVAFLSDAGSQTQGLAG